MESRRGRSTILLIIASVATVAGAIIVILATTAPFPSEASFGWFAYSPLSDAVFVPSVAIAFPTWALAGFGLFVAGVVAISFMLGQRSGNNRRGSDAPLP